jgi:SSS family solute:Na+ symporter
VITAYVGPRTDEATLIDFYRKVRPPGPGWSSIRALAGISEAEAATWAKRDNIPLAMIGWVSGTVLIWAALFTVGNFLYGRMGYAWSLLALSIAASTVLIGVIRRLWV